MKSLPSYIRDTTDFINLISTTKLPTDSYLVSIDVSSLYTNIPHKEGVEAVLNALLTQTNPDHQSKY